MSTLFPKLLFPIRKFCIPSLVKCSSKQYQELPSSLYVVYEARKKCFSALDPYLDIYGTFKDIPKLKKNLESRRMKIDVDSLYEKSILYSDLKCAIASYEIKSKNNLSDEEWKHANNQIKSVKQKLIELETSFIIPFLKLPNNLHSNVTMEDKDIVVNLSKPGFDFNPNSHAQIGCQSGELYFGDVSPTSYYMSGCLAILELAVAEYLSSLLKSYNFRIYSNMDFAKAVLVEGCGIDIKNLDNVFKIEDDKVMVDNQVQYLVGGASLPSFVAQFCKSNVKFSDDSPIKLFSIGRRYEPVGQNADTSLFKAVQATSVNSFIAYPQVVCEETLLNETTEMITHIYSQLGLHFKLVQYAASKLKTNEALAIGICMYSPHLEVYIEVGRISLYETFISKRLLSLQDLGNQKGTFLGMMHVEVMNLRNWIGCLIENTQTLEGHYAIPKCLQPFMYETDCKYF